MEDRKLVKGLSVTAIILIALAALTMSINSSNEIMRNPQSGAGFFFVAAIAVPLLAVLIVLASQLKSMDTLEDMMAAVTSRYAIFGWFFIFFIKTVSLALELIIPDFYRAHFSTVYLILNSFNVCVVGTLVLLIGLRKLPKTKIEKHSLKFGQLTLLILMMYGLTQIGSVMGLPIHLALSAFSISEEGDLGTLGNLLVGSDSIVRIITVGILPAIFEELLFRKFLIDRTIRYGEFVSCAMSGIMFGLWHGNFQQFFFAFFIGVLFSFVYIRTGRIIYTMILHASLNVVTSSITTNLLGKLMEAMGYDLSTGTISEPALDSAAMSKLVPLILLTFLWIMVIAGIQIAGVILVIVKRKKFKLVAREGEPSRKTIIHTLTHNVTTWVFFSFALLLFVYYYLPDIIAFVASRF